MTPAISIPPRVKESLARHQRASGAAEASAIEYLLTPLSRAWYQSVVIFDYELANFAEGLRIRALKDIDLGAFSVNLCESDVTFATLNHRPQ